jgi:acetolactate synthase small subunit
MRNDFIIEVLADNNFSVLNRMINVLNRRRVRIKKLVAHENEENFRKGGATMLLHTTPEMIEKVKQQLEKLIEVESATYYEADGLQLETLFSADVLTAKRLSKSY